MLACFLHHRDEDEAEEVVADAAVEDEVFDFFDEEDGHESDEGESDDEGDDGLG